MQDTELWQRLIGGDKGALGLIYSQHADYLLQYGHRLTQDELIIEDCVHDLFVDLWRTHNGLSPTNAIRPYLIVSLRRRIIRKIQQQQKFKDQEKVPEIDFQAEIAVDELIISQEVSEEQAAMLKKAFTQLTGRQREAIFLKYYEEMDYKDIAETMGISYQSVRNVVFTGIKKLREIMVLVCILIGSLFIL